MRILVVGGTGHIGSYLVPRLMMAKKNKLECFQAVVKTGFKAER